MLQRVVVSPDFTNDKGAPFIYRRELCSCRPVEVHAAHITTPHRFQNDLKVPFYFLFYALFLVLGCFEWFFGGGIAELYIRHTAYALLKILTKVYSTVVEFFFIAIVVVFER